MMKGMAPDFYVDFTKVYYKKLDIKQPFLTAYKKLEKLI